LGSVTKVELVVRGYMSRSLTTTKNTLNVHLKNVTGTFGGRAIFFL
jgi:hypothetical protein